MLDDRYCKNLIYRMIFVYKINRASNDDVSIMMCVSQAHIVHMCGATITKRLNEFANTEAATLTVSYFIMIQSASSCRVIR